MALGPWGGLRIREVSYGLRSIGCPCEEEETYIGDVVMYLLCSYKYANGNLLCSYKYA